MLNRYLCALPHKIVATFFLLTLTCHAEIDYEKRILDFSEDSVPILNEILRRLDQRLINAEDRGLSLIFDQDQNTGIDVEETADVNIINFYTNVSDAKTKQLYVEDGLIAPATDNDVDLGSSSLRFKNIYVYDVFASNIASGSVVFGGADGQLIDDNTNFVWDDTSKHLGIGTPTPSAKLTVLRGNIFVDDQYLTTNPLRVPLDVYSDIDDFRIRNSNRLFLDFDTNTDASGYLQIRKDEVAYVMVDNAGFVGINEATPDAMLEINSNIATQEVVIIKGASGQSENLLEWRDSSDNVFGVIEPSGDVIIGAVSGSYSMDVRKAGGSGQIYNTTDGGKTDFYLSGDNLAAAAKWFLMQFVADDATDGAVYFTPNGTSASGSVLAMQAGGSVAVGSNSPVSLFESDGRVGEAIQTVATDTTVDLTHSTVLVSASPSAVTITMPTAASAYNSTDGIGGIYTIKKIDSSGNAVTVDGNSSETIDDTATKVISTQYDSITVQSDGTEWFIL